jgi:hypothetical protein
MIPLGGGEDVVFGFNLVDEYFIDLSNKTAILNLYSNQIE